MSETDGVRPRRATEEVALTPHDLHAALQLIKEYTAQVHDLTSAYDYSRTKRARALAVIGMLASAASVIIFGKKGFPELSPAAWIFSLFGAVISGMLLVVSDVSRLRRARTELSVAAQSLWKIVRRVSQLYEYRDASLTLADKLQLDVRLAAAEVSLDNARAVGALSSSHELAWRLSQNTDERSAVIVEVAEKNTRR
jgi:hypothetical protein